MFLILSIDPCKNAAYLSFFTASSSISITIVAAVGNSPAVFAVVWNPNKDLRTLFVANHNIADLVAGLILSRATVYEKSYPRGT